MSGGGLFVTLEGAEGCGKSTQAGRLVEKLRGLGYRVQALREPGGTALGEEIRHTLKHSPAGRGMSAEAELLLMNAARAQLVRQVIRPALAQGEVVVCDRFLDSTVAYQGWGRGLALEQVGAVLAFAVDGTVPDLTLLLELASEVAEARRRQREASGGSAPDRFEEETRVFHDRVAAGFRAIAMAEPARVVRVDASAGVEDVAQAVWKQVEPRLAGVPRRV